MKRLLPLVALPLLLLLAGTARAGDVHDLEAAVQKAAERVEQIEDHFRKTDDPQKREAIERKLKSALERLNHLETKLEAVRREKLAAGAAEFVAEGQKMYEVAQKHLKHLEVMHHEIEVTYERRKVEGRHEDMKRLEEEAHRIQKAADLIRHSLGLLEEAKIQLEHGDFESARETFEQAKRHLHEVHEHAQKRAHGEPGRKEAPVRERLEHLRAAAGHLHEAGAHEQAEMLVREIQKVEEHLKREHAARHPEGEGAAHAIHEAIEGLRHEVRELRKEVREIRELLQHERRR